MNSTEKNFSQNIIESYPEFEQTLGERTKNSIHQKRLEALEILKNLPLPTPKHEEWKYTNLREISKNNLVFDFKQENAETFYTNSIETQFIHSPQSNVLVFVNGVFIEKSSHIISQDFELLNLQDAENQEVFKNSFAQIADSRKDYFTALNTAYASNGVYLRIKKGKVVEEPIFIYQILVNNQKENFSQVRNLIVAEENSQATLVEICISEGDKKGIFNEVTEFFIAPNAIFDYYKLQNEHENISHIDTVQVKQENKSVFSVTTLSLNGGIIRNNLNISISGEYCESYMNGLSLISGKTHVDNHTLADHQKPNSYSNELYKGIFDEKSTGVFNGKIYVQPDAQKTNAYQQNRNILLTNEASINAKPQLEIWADDVKCSHGATTGQLDTDALFYMQARGIPALAAKKLLIQAFVGEIVEKIKPVAFKDYVENIIEKRLQA
jgi:Fe-S cluster assembly protein SufD